MLRVIEEAGGRATSSLVRERLADAIELPPEDRDRRVRVGSGGSWINQWGRTNRWVFQRAALAGLARAVAPGDWALTERGDQTLHNAAPGVVVRIYETDQGVMLWGEWEAAVGLIEDESIDLYFSSLPYADQAKPYESQFSERAHVDWALSLAERVKPKLRDTGSFVLNLAPGYEQGRPVESTWIERLILRLVDEIGLLKCQTMYWHNPARLPSPAQWVCVTRERVVADVEPVLWFAKNAHPFVDQRAALRPYSSAMIERIRSGGERGAIRPSGHVLRPGRFAADHGGSIPRALIRAANTDSNSHYLRRCRETGIPVHPARFPAALPEHLIRLLTPRGGLVGDLTSGSGETPAAAQRLGRRWVATDLSLTYGRGSSFHFEREPGYQCFLPDHLRPPPPRQGDLFGFAPPPRRGDAE